MGEMSAEIDDGLIWTGWDAGWDVASRLFNVNGLWPWIDYRVIGACYVTVKLYA